MDLIFHEKQQGRLCGQHCLNNLLQDSYFTAVELAEIGQQLDAEQGVNTTSDNVDDSGYFSFHVLVKALESFSLTLINYSDDTPEANRSRTSPTQEQAYICHFGNHWFTIRKIGQKWFDLNSTLSNPKLISDTHLALYVMQLIQEGYHVFVVKGNVPPSPADEMILLNPPELSADPVPSTITSSEDDPELQEALKISRQLHDGTVVNQEEDNDLQKAIQASLEATVPTQLSTEEIRARRLQYFK